MRRKKRCIKSYGGTDAPLLDCGSPSSRNPDALARRVDVCVCATIRMIFSVCLLVWVCFMMTRLFGVQRLCILHITTSNPGEILLCCFLILCIDGVRGKRKSKESI